MKSKVLLNKLKRNIASIKSWFVYVENRRRNEGKREEKEKERKGESVKKREIRNVYLIIVVRVS